MKKLIACLIAATAILLFGFSYTGAQEVIKIGLITPLTGSGTLFGVTAKDGFVMAVEDVNAKGGVNGKKLEGIIYDSQSKPPVAASLAQRLILEDKVVLIDVGTGSLDALAMMEVTERQKFPLFISSSASPMITEKGYKWVWRMSLTDAVSAQLLAKYIGSKPNWKKIAILCENTDYGKPPSEIVEKLIKENKEKQIVAFETYNRGDTDISGQLVKIKKGSPDVLVTWGYYTEAALIARQGQQIGLQAQLIGNQALGFPEYIQLAGPASEGVMHVNTSSSHINPDPKIQAFAKRYEEKFKRVPSITSVDNYDGVMVITEILSKVGTNPVKIQQALNTMTFQGIAETIKFDSKGQGAKGAIVAQVAGNRFKFVEYLKH